VGKRCSYLDRYGRERETSSGCNGRRYIISMVVGCPKKSINGIIKHKTHENPDIDPFEINRKEKRPASEEQDRKTRT
jgi:hypothetical protein